MTPKPLGLNLAVFAREILSTARMPNRPQSRCSSLAKSVLGSLCCGWLSLALSAACLADTEAFLTRPDIHGNQVVFTAEEDLWLADITTGDARRLTSDPGVETNAHFSPDGTQLAFSANYDGGADV